MILPADPALRALFLIFGAFDPKTPPDETPMGRARYCAGWAQKLFADFASKALVAERDYPLPSPLQEPAFRSALHTFEKDLNQVEARFQSEVRGPRDLLAQEVNKFPIIGATDAAQAIREVDILAWLERQPGTHLQRGSIVFEAIRDGDELLYLAVMGAGSTRQKRLFGEVDISGTPVIQKMRETWLDSKADQTKKATLARLNVVVKQVEDLFKKLRFDAQARVGVAPSPEEQMRGRLISSSRGASQ